MDRLTSGETPSSACSGDVVFILLTIYTLNFLDRQIMALLAAPLKADLGLGVLQLRLLTGFAGGTGLLRYLQHRSGGLFALDPGPR